MIKKIGKLKLSYDCFDMWECAQSLTLHFSIEYRTNLMFNERDITINLGLIKWFTYLSIEWTPKQKENK